MCSCVFRKPIGPLLNETKSLEKSKKQARRTQELVTTLGKHIFRAKKFRSSLRT